MGAAVAVADFDRDGWPDFYVTNSAEGSLNHLYRNQGDGTFTRRRRRRWASPTSTASAPACRWAPSGATTTTTATRICFVYKYGRPELFHNDAGRWLHAGRRERAGLPRVGQRQQRRLARLRPRRPARSVPRRLLARGRRPLASEDHADHAGELRVRRTTAAASTCSTTAATARSTNVARTLGLDFPPLDACRGCGRSRAARAIRICSSRTTTASRSSIANQGGKGFVDVGARDRRRAARRRAG